MIRQKFLKVLYWIKDHFRFLVEVVIRLSVGIENKTSNPKSLLEDKDNSTHIESKEEDYND